MTFGIASYRRDLENRLRTIPERARAAFCGWCAQSLLAECMPYVETKGGALAVNALRQGLNLVWDYAAGATPYGEIEDAYRKCNSIDWDPEGVQDREQGSNICAVEAISSLLHAARKGVGSRIIRLIFS